MDSCCEHDIAILTKIQGSSYETSSIKDGRCRHRLSVPFRPHPTPPPPARTTDSHAAFTGRAREQNHLSVARAGYPASSCNPAKPLSPWTTRRWQLRIAGEKTHVNYTVDCARPVRGSPPHSRVLCGREQKHIVCTLPGKASPDFAEGVR